MNAHWPDVLVLDTIPPDEADMVDAVDSADRDGQRIRLRAPLAFGVNPARALRFLILAAERYVRVEWRLADELPWPLHTVVHLPPPAETGDEIVKQWRDRFDLALCTYRYGPGFVMLRDNRPGKERFRAHLGADWVRPFRDLVAGTGQHSQLLDELVDAGLALRLDDGRHVVLAVRLRRWPVPYFAV